MARNVELSDSQAVLEKLVADVELADQLHRDLTAEENQQNRLEVLEELEPTVAYRQGGVGEDSDDGSAADSAIFDKIEPIDQQLADEIAQSFPSPPESMDHLDAVDRFAEVRECSFFIETLIVVFKCYCYYRSSTKPSQKN